MFTASYTHWLERFTRVFITFKTGETPQDGVTLESAQLFLLDHGQFNANFTLPELTRLGYPLSPFATMDRHTYLRSTDTWACEILGMLYREVYGEKLQPIFLHSNLFWRELDRYCRTVTEDDIAGDEFLAVLEEAYANEGTLEHPLWIQLTQQDEMLTHKKDISDKIKLRLLEMVATKHEINECLIPILQAILNGDTSDIKTRFNQPEVLAALEHLFPEELYKARESYEKDLETLQLPREDLTQCDSDWFAKVLGLAKKNQIPLPNSKIKNKVDLECYAKTANNQAAFSQFLSQIRTASKVKRPEANAYIVPIQTWNKEHVGSLFQKIAKKIVYCYPHEFEGIPAIVFCDYTEGLPDFVTGIMGNLGYRMDPIQVARTLLKKFPALFIDADATQKFWQLLMQTPMILGLEAEEQRQIRELGDKVIETIQQEPVEIEEDTFFEEEHNTLRGRVISQPNFNLYAKFILSYLNDYQTEYSSNSTMQAIVNTEIKEALQIFLLAVQRENISMAIRAVQVLAEVMLFDLDNKPLAKSLVSIIKDNYLSSFPVQGVLLTPYAMKAFVRVFQIISREYRHIRPTIFVTNQSYFEWLSNLEHMKSIHGASVIPVRHLTEINQTADIIFIEIHPNNVVERKQFAHHLRSLLTPMSSQTWKNKGRTLVIDVTLNALNDPEIQGILNDATLLVNDGWLNIILIQSLTKFSQLGLDKRSGGMLTVINNGQPCWDKINKKLRSMIQIEPVDPSTLNFFAYFFQQHALMEEYVRSINANVRFVYQHIMQQFAQVEVINRDRFQITMSSDPKACYIAINMRGLLPQVDMGFKLTSDDVESFVKDLIQHLIYPLCIFFDLPLTERMSIGFPLTSVNSVFDSLRFTIGLEEPQALERYAEILAYTTFVLNRQRDPKLFFDTDPERSYDARIKYFQEKVRQFKGMTPGGNYSYRFSFPEANPSYRGRQLMRNVQLSNGQMRLEWETPNQANFRLDTIWLPYDHHSLYLPQGIPFSDPRVTVQQRRMAAACLADSRPGQRNYQNVKLILTPHTVSFSSMNVSHRWTVENFYGPFLLNNQSASFSLYQKNISLHFNRQIYREQWIAIRQGNVTIPLLDMPLEDRELFFREGAYAPEELMLYGQGEASYQHKPIYPMLRLSIEANRCIVQHDEICCQETGVTIYKRFISPSSTYIEIDYWGEKEPRLARFLTLMIAISIRDNTGVNFIARNEQFCYFLFQLAFQQANEVFSSAAQNVIKHKEELSQKLTSYQRTDRGQRQYQFFTLSDPFPPTWASGSGVSHVIDEELILEGLAVLKP